MPKNVNLDIQGSSGLNRFSGYVHEEFLTELQGQRGIRIYKEMRDNSSVVGSVLFIIKSLARNLKWEIKPQEGQEKNPEAIKNAEFISSCMDDMSLTWNDLISEIFSMLTFGWSYFEEVYKIRGGDSKDPKKRSKYNDGKIGWRKIALRAQETLLHWEFDEDGGIKGMWQTSPPNFGMKFIPIEKSLLFRTEIHKNNPEGRSILRNAVIDYFYLKRITEAEAIAVSRDMTGLITMEVPGPLLKINADAESKALRLELEKMLSSIHRDQREYALIPPELDREGKPTGYKLKLLSSGGKKQTDTNSIILRNNKHIAMSMMTDFQYLGLYESGSFALSTNKTELFSMSMGAFLDSIAKVFERFAFPRLLKLNGMDSSLIPYLTHGKLVNHSLDEISSYLSKLTGVQLISGSDELEDKLLNLANLPTRGNKERFKERKRREAAGFGRLREEDNDEDDNDDDNDDDKAIDDNKNL